MFDGRPSIKFGARMKFSLDCGRSNTAANAAPADIKIRAGAVGRGRRAITTEISWRRINALINREEAVECLNFDRIKKNLSTM